MSDLTHLNDQGRAKMVDVSDKAETVRVAVARGEIRMLPATLALIEQGAVAKGDVLAVAQVAGIMGAKRTPDLIPMCHPLGLTGVDITFHLQRSAGIVEIEATAKITGKTGVEMEAMTAVAVCALTIYDMCKAVDKEMTIGEIRLISKSGGKSGQFLRKGEAAWEK